jgi:hypothetical protein
MGALDWQIAYPGALLRLALKAAMAWAEQSIGQSRGYAIEHAATLGAKANPLWLHFLV